MAKPKTRTYTAWESMKNRCKGLVSKKNYYDKGIRHCKKWDKFENFLEDMGLCPPNYELDRINNVKGYYKRNCRWVTKKQQCSNKVFKSNKGLPRGIEKTKAGNYVARLYSSGVNEYLGTYKTIKKAKSVYLSAYKKIYNELPQEYRRGLYERNKNRY